MSKHHVDESLVKAFLERAVENVYPDLGVVEKALCSGKKLRIYTGIDPTGPTLHLGHLIWLRKLAELQKMGHEIILLIGDFTAMIGDPTDKGATRVRLTRKQVLANCKQYKKQASKFISFAGKNPAKLLFNSKWLAKMSFTDVVELSSHFTVQQMSERDMFKRRMRGEYKCPHCGNHGALDLEDSAKLQGHATKDESLTIMPAGFELSCDVCKKNFKGLLGQTISPLKPVYLHEFLYPLMQGYDSVAMDVDMEIGGNDQTFNMLAGRTLLREMKGKEKFVITMQLLTDTSGKKMGKSEGNMLTFEDTPEDMYGKVMSWTDGMILPAFRLCTDVELGEIERIEDLMEKGGNPVEFKHELARKVVEVFYGEKIGWSAREHFNAVHKNKEIPDEMPEIAFKSGMTLIDALIEGQLVTSKGDARRQIEQGGVKINGEVVKDGNIVVASGQVIQKGKRHFVKIRD